MVDESAKSLKSRGSILKHGTLVCWRLGRHEVWSMRFVNGQAREVSRWKVGVMKGIGQLGWNEKVEVAG